MLKYCVDKWYNGKNNLEAAIREIAQDKYCYICYKELMDLIVKHILNDTGLIWDAENITVIDNGEYQGTLIFAIPMKTYQPFANQYLMTTISYGSCSVCDTLQSACHTENIEERIKEIMLICLHLIQNMVHPFKFTWGDENLNVETDEEIT